MIMPGTPGRCSEYPAVAGPAVARRRPGAGPRTFALRPRTGPACTRPLRPAGLLRRQPVTLTAPVSMWPVARRLQLESLLTVTVKSYQPLAMVTALK